MSFTITLTCQTTVPPGDLLPTIKVKGLNNKTPAVHSQSDYSGTPL